MKLQEHHIVPLGILIFGSVLLLCVLGLGMHELSANREAYYKCLEMNAEILKSNPHGMTLYCRM